MSERHPAVLVASIGLPVALLAGVIVAANLAQRDDEPATLGLSNVPVPAGDSESCTSLAAALPDSMAEFVRAEIAEPRPAATEAWRAADGRSVVLRCGIDMPAEFVVGAGLQSVNGVQWFEAAGTTPEAVTYVVVDRDVYVSVSVPPNAGPTPLQSISDAVSSVMTAVAPAPRPLPGS